MSDKKFSAVMGILVPEIVHLIVENYPEHSETTAMNELSTSKVYSILEDESTKLWHFSPLTLFNMFDEEKRTGRFEWPEEA